MRNLIIDIGNTRGKIAVYEGMEMLTDVVAVSHEQVAERALAMAEELDVRRGMYASVARQDVGRAMAERLADRGIEMVQLTAQSRLPFSLQYPTLGADRVAAIVAGVSEFAGHELLIIDAGTAVTYEYVAAEGIYRGGNISPGLQMRFRALHAFTGLLPEVSADEYRGEIGTSTASAIAAGVVDGFRMEVEGVVGRFVEKYADESIKKAIILTGGDYKRLVLKVKSCIFARPNLVMDGVASACEIHFGTQIG